MDASFICSICGYKGDFIVEGVGKRDDYRCQFCRSMVRQRDVAQVILDEFGRGAALSLSEAIRKKFLDDVEIYEAGMQGPIHKSLSTLPRYVNSYFWENVPPGSIKNNVRCEDLTDLTFPGHSFDLIISLEVFEHIFDVTAAIEEIERVLKIGGIHVFSIPVRFPYPETTETLASVESSGLIIHHSKPRYHVAGDQSKSLVVSEFGQDLIELHKECGLRLSVVRRSSPFDGPHQNATFIARKLGNRL